MNGGSVTDAIASVPASSTLAISGTANVSNGVTSNEGVLTISGGTVGNVTNAATASPNGVTITDGTVGNVTNNATATTPINVGGGQVSSVTIDTAGAGNINVYGGAAVGLPLGSAATEVVENKGTGTIALGTAPAVATAAVPTDFACTVNGSVSNESTGSITINQTSVTGTVTNSNGGDVTITDSKTGNVSNSGNAITATLSIEGSEVGDVTNGASAGALTMGNTEAASVTNSSNTTGADGSTLTDVTVSGAIQNSGSGDLSLTGDTSAASVDGGASGTTTISTTGPGAIGTISESGGTVKISQGVFDPLPTDPNYYENPTSTYGYEEDGDWYVWSGNDALSNANKGSNGRYPVYEIDNGYPFPMATPNASAATIKGFGFVGQNTANADGHDHCAADVAIAKALGITLGSDSESWTTASQADNVMWAVIQGTRNCNYGVAFTRAGANNLDQVPFTTGGNMAKGAKDVSAVLTNAQGLGVVWVTLDYDAGANTSSVADSIDTTPNAPNGIPVDNDSGIYAADTLTGTLSGAYTASAWPAQGYATVGASASSPVSVTGVTYAAGVSPEPAEFDNVQPNPVFGVTGEDISMPGAGVSYTDSYGDLLSLSGWSNSETVFPVGSSYELPAFPSIGRNVQLTAQWGTPVNLVVPTNGNSVDNFPDVWNNSGNQNFEFAYLTPDGDDPYAVLANQPPAPNYTYTIGADSKGALPQLPVLVPNIDPDTGYANDNLAFMGWYSYDPATDTYTLYQEGDSIADLAEDSGTATLYALVADAQLAWEPDTADAPAVVVGNGIDLTVTASMNTSETLPADSKAAVPEASQDAQDLFLALVSGNFSQAYKPGTDDPATSATGLQNISVQAGTTPTVNPKNITVTTEPDGLSVKLTATPSDAFGPTRFYAVASLPAYYLNNTVSSATGSVTVQVNKLVLTRVTPEGSGTISQVVNPDNPNQAILTATPAEGYRFVEWQNGVGASLGNNPVLTVNIDDSVLQPYTAVFELGSGQLPSGEVPVYRVYNPFSYEHLYTTSKVEYDGLVDAGWDDEGIAWNAPGASTVAVYRLFNPYSFDHYYTTNRAEAAGLVELGWVYDFDGEAAFYGAVDSDIPIYQLFNPYETTNTHLWTADLNEYTELATRGWQQEGPKWDAVSMPV